MKPSSIVVGVLFLIALATLTCQSVVADEKAPSNRLSPADHFRERVRPLFSRKCLGCHGENDKVEGGLDLRSDEGLRKGGESGPVIKPGNPEQSALFQAVLRTGDIVMPPKERNKLNADETEILRRWIEEGAVWATNETPRTVQTENTSEVAVATSGGLSDGWTNRKYNKDDIWAYQPVQRPDVPWSALQRTRGTARNPIDAFIARKLVEHELTAADPADRRILIRRVTLDLTGLPPTPEQVESFVKDTSPQAYSKLVQRLLASKTYGEQQARHWLDVVRYADTSGFSNDYERPNAWRYRDYVIRSFNEDKPFDRLIVEQIAGDELSPSDPEMLIAVGFLRMGPWEHTAMSVATITRQQFLDDVTHSVGVSFLGQGLRCARCHDHKFDPVPTRDYYRIQAAFAPVQFADRKVEYLPSENTSHFAETKARTMRILEKDRAYTRSVSVKTKAALAAFLKEKGVKSINQIPKGERPNQSTIGLNYLELSQRKIANKRINYFDREMKRYEPLAFSVYNGPPQSILIASFGQHDARERQA